MTSQQAPIISAGHSTYHHTRAQVSFTGEIEMAILLASRDIGGRRAMSHYLIAHFLAWHALYAAADGSPSFRTNAMRRILAA
jgi:hypothetical protein